MLVYTVLDKLVPLPRMQRFWPIDFKQGEALENLNTWNIHSEIVFKGSRHNFWFPVLEIFFSYKAKQQTCLPDVSISPGFLPCLLCRWDSFVSTWERGTRYVDEDIWIHLKTIWSWSALYLPSKLMCPLAVNPEMRQFFVSFVSSVFPRPRSKQHLNGGNDLKRKSMNLYCINEVKRLKNNANMRRGISK